MQFLEEHNVHLLRAGTTEWLGHGSVTGEAVYFSGDLSSFGIVLGRVDHERVLVAWSRPPGDLVRFGQEVAATSSTLTSSRTFEPPRRRRDHR